MYIFISLLMYNGSQAIFILSSSEVMVTRLNRGYSLYNMPTFIKKLIYGFEDLFTLLSQYWNYCLMSVAFEAMCGHFLQTNTTYLSTLLLQVVQKST
jgi:hypothetical protein